MSTKINVFILLVFLCSCGNRGKDEVSVVAPLKASKIYHASSVKEYIETLKHSTNQEKSDEYLAKAAEAQQANDPKALFYYKRAITYFPSPKAYSGLAKYLLYKKQFEECIEALDAAIYIFHPAETAPYGDFLIASLLVNQLRSPYTYTEAIDNGLLTANDLLAYIQKSWPVIYKSKGRIINQFIANLSNDFVADQELYEATISFADYWIQVPPLTEPFSITQNDLENFDYSYTESPNFFSSFYPESVGDSGIYILTNLIAKLPDSGSYRAVIYKVDSSEIGARKNIRMIYYRLCTYTPDGAIIDSKVLAAQLGERFETCKLNNGIFTITQSKRNWSKPFSRRAFDNDLLSTEFLGTISYQIAADGKIVPIEFPQNQANPETNASNIN